MDEEQKNVIEETKENRIAQQEHSNGVNLTGIILLLVVLLFCNIYLCYISSIHRILLVRMENKVSYSDASDSVQVNNALRNGGSIVIKDSNDGYKKAFGEEYGRYGASDSSGYYYTKGAVLNYIASRGWKLIQAPSSGLTDEYYFVK